MNLREKGTKRLHKLNSGWSSLMLDKKEISSCWEAEICQKMDAKSDALKPISYQAEMKMDLATEREAMFDHVYKQHQNASIILICTEWTGMP